jgi:hypothetical protein
MLSSGKLDTKKIVTHEFDFKDVIKAFEFADNPDNQKMKVMIRYKDLLYKRPNVVKVLIQMFNCFIGL